MDKYLLEILKDVNTIIIPGLGALTITNHDTGEIMFMSYLKHDDGKLASYIAEKEGMEVNDAKNLIAKYVREITTQLDKGESYDMFQFGSFIKDGDEVDFKNWSEDSTETAVPTTEDSKEDEEKKVEEKSTPVIPPVVEEKAEEKPEKKDEAEKVEDKKKDETPPPTPKKPRKEEKKDERKQEKVTPVVPISKSTETKAQPLKEEPKEKELNILEKEELSANSEKLNKLKKEKEEGKKKKKRGAGFYILIILLVLLAGGGTYVGIFYDDVKQHIPFLADAPANETEENEAYDEMAETLGLDEEDNNSEDANGSNEEIQEETDGGDEMMEDASPETEEKIEVEEAPVAEETPVQEQAPVSTSSGGPFHLIAGSFSSEENANRLVERLKSEGYPARIMFGSGLHMVSVKSYPTRADANAGKSEVSGVAPKAWVLEWR